MITEKMILRIASSSRSRNNLWWANAQKDRWTDTRLDKGISKMMYRGLDEQMDKQMLGCFLLHFECPNGWMDGRIKG